MKRYDANSAVQIAVRIAEAAGVPSNDAHILADSLVQADLTGVATHGLSRLSIYVRRIQKGLIRAAAEPAVERRRASTLVVNGNNGLGQVTAIKVLDQLEKISRECGVASATIRNSQHFGALSYYCNRAAEREMILIAATNCEPAMSPEGGSQAYFGTNPIGASFPTDMGFPVKADLATSVVARGNIIAASKKRESIPAGWALDVDGNPTQDASKALLGTMLTMAGHKGYALALIVEVLSGVLSGSAIGTSIGSMYKDMDRSQDVGHFFCLLDISAFMDPGEFRRRMGRMVSEIKACRRRPGVDEILVPGERSHRTRQERLRLGIPLDPVTVTELEQLSRELDVDFRTLRFRQNCEGVHDV